MNRPDKLNAADGEMHSDLTEIWRVIDADPSTDVAILRVSLRGVIAPSPLPLGNSSTVQIGDPTSTRCASCGAATDRKTSNTRRVLVLALNSLTAFS